MRLIDADKAKEYIDLCSCGIGGEMGKALMHLYKWAKELIDTVPTVEDKPQGEWIDTNSKSFEFHRVYKCSECGTTEIEYPESIYRHFRYCPNCGAKMVEPQESEDKE